VSKLLGIAAKSYNEDLLTVFGEEAVRALDETPGAVYAGGYLVIGDYDKAVLTKENMRIVKDKWRAVLVGSKELNDLTDPVVREKIESSSKASFYFCRVGAREHADEFTSIFLLCAASAAVHGFCKYDFNVSLFGCFVNCSVTYIIAVSGEEANRSVAFGHIPLFLEVRAYARDNLDHKYSSSKFIVFHDMYLL
jgi:hypothetical protein